MVLIMRSTPLKWPSPSLVLWHSSLEAFAQEVPLGRLGKAEEVGQVIKFLISDQASYITGQVINVNGGYLD